MNAGGFGLDAQWSDDLHHALHVKLTGETPGYYADFAAPDALERVLREAFFHAGTWSSFRERTHGRPVDTRTVPGHRFLGYLQNHDQIGNRATGDRLSATVSPGLLACGAALVFCSPYTPMVFMGEEWAACTPWQFFASFPDPELAEAVRTGRRREFSRHGWGESDVPDPMDPATVERSRLDWAEVERPGHREVLELYRALIAAAPRAARAGRSLGRGPARRRRAGRVVARAAPRRAAAGVQLRPGPGHAAARGHRVAAHVGRGHRGRRGRAPAPGQLRHRRNDTLTAVTSG